VGFGIGDFDEASCTVIFFESFLPERIDFFGDLLES
jgi:hypothetical protein